MMCSQIDGVTLSSVYGHQWRNWNYVDQIKNLIRGLKENPDGRRHMVSLEGR